jgi:hypothetical protein
MELNTMDRKKELKRIYKDTPRPMGVFQIKNTVSGKIFMGTSMDLPAILRRYRFALDMNGHPNKALQEDWNSLGPEAFAFEILEEIDAEKIPQDKWPRAVAELEEKWQARLTPYNDKGYHKEPMKA